MKRALALLVAVVTLFAAPTALAADVYEGYDKVGSVNRAYGDRYEVKAGYSKVGYVKRGYGSNWTIFSGYSKVGEIRGSITGGPAGGAALLLLIG